MRNLWLALAMTAMVFAGASAPAQQVRTIDPNQAIDGDIAPVRPSASPAPAETPLSLPPPPPASDLPPVSDLPPASGTPSSSDRATTTTQAAGTFQRDDLISAGEGVFGKGAEGLASMLESILRDQGEPNAYIAGREASGAFIVGLRYGSGVMTHKIEGQRPVYWTGPSVGFDVGGDANKVFVLVYNLYDTEELYRRFPAAEGRLYFVGGFAATYLRRGNVVLIPVRLGVGWRAGVNVGYMKFSHESKWLPF